FQAEDGIRDFHVTGVQTCALPICDLEASSVKLHYPFYEVLEVRGNHHLEEVHFHHTRTGERHVIPAQEMIIAIGFSGRLGPLAEIGRASCRERREVPVVAATENDK